MRCPHCEQPVHRVDGAVDPRTAETGYRCHPCGHNVGPLVAAKATTAGVAVTTPGITGATLIGAERVRQVTDEGYTPEHDRHHTGAELAWAAFCYLDRAAADKPTPEQAPPVWPWNRADWKAEKSPLRLLIIAGALIAAEIDRRLSTGEKP